MPAHEAPFDEAQRRPITTLWSIHGNQPASTSRRHAIQGNRLAEDANGHMQTGCEGVTCRVSRR